jgi:hypothetical protein
MMQVKLLEDRHTGYGQVKTVVRHKPVIDKGGRLVLDKDGKPKINTSRIAHFADTVVTVSDETGKKWIAQGKAKKVG